eukprot:m.424062 g.424062  ORF g.424062 m.424062 type:complete len:394 (-) comp21337_c0_seq1:1225-2406(-)
MASIAGEDAGEIPGLENADVVTKYKMAGEMASRVLKAVREKCVAGAKTFDICKFGDEQIMAEVGTVYNKKDDNGKLVPKGVGFPTCISVNHCICHNCPIESDAEILLADGDVIKIDLAVHIDGFIAPVATTFVLGESEVTGRKADVIMAAHLSAEVGLRMLRPGAKLSSVTKAIDKVCESFNCTAVEGMLSHQLTKNKIDGEKAVILNPNEQQNKDHKDGVVEANEVYAIECIVSTGEGKSREGEQRTTVFKKSDLVYQLKMKSSRSFFSEVTKKFNVMPFTLRAISDEKTAKLGCTECVKHDVIVPYKVLWEKDSEIVAQFKILVLVMPNGNLRGTTDSQFDVSTIKSECKVDDEEINALLKTQVGSKNKKKKKAKKASASGGDAAPAADGK